MPLPPLGGFAQNGEYPSRNAGAVRGPRYASWNGSDTNVGSLISEPFRAGVAVVFFVDGYPTEDGEQIYRARRGREPADDSLFPFPGRALDAWAYRLPPSWYGATVRLHAVDSSARAFGWLGVADVRNASLLETFVRFERPWYAWGWAFVCIALLLACAPALDARSARRLPAATGPAVFFLSLFVALCFLRLPAITDGGELNADEAQMTAQAITFLRHPIPWVDFDGTTSGPLNSMVVGIPALFGFAPTLPGSRAVGLCLFFLTLVCLYLTQRRLWGELPARLGVLLPFALFGGATDGAYVQYASELLPLCLIAAALLWAVDAAQHRRATPWLAGLSGSLLGALPFAKLQAAPFAVLLAGAWAVIIATRRRETQMPAWLAFAGGLACVPSLLTAVVAARGGFNDFLASYVLLPRTYVTENCSTSPARVSSSRTSRSARSSRSPGASPWRWPRPSPSARREHASRCARRAFCSRSLR